MKHMAFLLGTAAFLVGLFGMVRIADAPATALAELPTEPARYTLAFVGDIMLDRSVRKKVESIGAGDYSFPFEPVADRLRGYDFLFGNIEGPVSDRGANQGSIYSFRMDPQTVPALERAGFDAVSLTNNHMADWGRAALSDTLDRFASSSIISVGAGHNDTKAYASQIFTLPDGTRLGLVAFSQFLRFFEAGTTTPGIALIDEAKVAQSIVQASGVSDIVVASFHWGDEYEPLPNAYQRRIADLAIASGADLIVGHHPHVGQPLERVGDAWVAWSLGNFVFDQYFSEETMQGRMLEVDIERGAVKNARLLISKQNKDFQVVEIK
jgi:gamma-polyglutamate biosynthesis protein CapA